MNLEEKGILGAGMTSLRTRQRLVERLTEQGIKDIRILEVIRAVSYTHLTLPTNREV